MARLFHNGHLAISCNNSCHLARGSAGGEDYPCGVGTPVFAPFSGTWRWRVAGTGGWTFTGISSQLAGAIAECMHTSRSNGFVLNGPARFVAEGGLLGWSGGAKGAPGAGSSTGPHMHEHGIWGGIRRGMSVFLSLFTAAAGGGATPLPGQPGTAAPTIGDTSMTQAIRVEFAEGVPDATAQKIKGYMGGAKLTSWAKGQGLYLLLTPNAGRASVQVSQLDRRGNEWAADNTGEYSGGGVTIDKSLRLYDLDEALELADAYLAAGLAVFAHGGDGGGGSFPAGPIELGPETRAELVGAIAAAADSLNPPDRSK